MVKDDQRKASDQRKALEPFICAIIMLISIIQFVNMNWNFILVDYYCYAFDVCHIAYLPSFYILYPIVINIYIYMSFLFACLLTSIYIFIKLKENMIIITFFILMVLDRVITANIDPFIFLIVLICIYYKDNDYIPPFLLAYICFKPSIILIIPYFFFKSTNKIKFLLLFGIALGLYNIYYIINIKSFIDFLNRGFMFNDYRTYTRVNFTFIYFYWVREYIVKFIKYINMGNFLWRNINFNKKNYG